MGDIFNHLFPNTEECDHIGNLLDSSCPDSFLDFQPIASSKESQSQTLSSSPNSLSHNLQTQEYSPRGIPPLIGYESTSVPVFLHDATPFILPCLSDCRTYEHVTEPIHVDSFGASSTCVEMPTTVPGCPNGDFSMSTPALVYPSGEFSGVYPNQSVSFPPDSCFSFAGQSLSGDLGYSLAQGDASAGPERFPSDTSRDTGLQSSNGREYVPAGSQGSDMGDCRLERPLFGAFRDVPYQFVNWVPSSLSPRESVALPPAQCSSPSLCSSSSSCTAQTETPSASKSSSATPSRSSSTESYQSSSTVSSSSSSSSSSSHCSTSSLGKRRSCPKELEISVGGKMFSVDTSKHWFRRYAQLSSVYKTIKDKCKPGVVTLSKAKELKYSCKCPLALPKRGDTDMEYLLKLFHRFEKWSYNSTTRAILLRRGYCTIKDKCKPGVVTLSKAKELKYSCKCPLALPKRGDTDMEYLLKLFHRFEKWSYNSTTRAILLRRGYCVNCLIRAKKDADNKSRGMNPSTGRKPEILRMALEGHDMETIYRTIFIDRASSPDEEDMLVYGWKELVEDDMKARDSEPSDREIAPHSFYFNEDLSVRDDGMYLRFMHYLTITKAEFLESIPLVKEAKSKLKSKRGTKKILYRMFIEDPDVEQRRSVYLKVKKTYDDNAKTSKSSKKKK
ncbi:hypothetical protein ADUPG1_000237 [Aduncisulcus paluster]|uniref:Uncharacterized protein n=1 Tax=Aduncisulcus paluster TaxID=2918883 RepID=A0ABQ5K5J8_9EUKA|nr:hypothetical protein ADUPG1_000237 [Aduncisulcus paluster]